MKRLYVPSVGSSVGSVGGRIFKGHKTFPVLNPALNTGESLPPASVAGLAGWWDFSDASTLYTDSGATLVSADGDVVGQANDKSGNSRHFRQTDNTKRGTYQTAEKNGLSVLRLDGVNDFMQCISSAATFDFLHTGGSTVFMVIKVGLVANPNTFYWLLDNCVLASSIGFRSGYYIRYDDRAASSYADANVHVVANGGNAPVNNVANDRAPAQTWVTNSIVSDPTNANVVSRSFIRKNGLNPISNNSNAFATSSTNASYALTLGAASGDGGNPAPMDIGELIIYNRTLSDSERTLVGIEYLLAKWGIS